MRIKKAALHSGLNHNILKNGNTFKKRGKLEKMLEVFASGESLNRFEAANLGDTILNTTVSDLQRKHSLLFKRKHEKIKNRFGSKTQVCRYWLEGQELDKAQTILGWKKQVMGAAG